MAVEKYDFSGWATKNDILCSDGVTIRRDAFKDDDGRVVPIVWQHQHNSPENVLGHGVLRNTPEGVRIDGKFNNSDMAQYAKELVHNKDITNLSIYANKLTKKGNNVVHGTIREVSLVLAGANPGATIDFPIIMHGDNAEIAEDEAIFYFPDDYELTVMHAEEEKKEEEMPKEEKSEKTVQDVLDTFNDEQKSFMNFLLEHALSGESIEDIEDEVESEEPDDESDGEESDFERIYKSFNKEQSDVLKYVVGRALEEAEEATEEADEEDDEEDEDEGDEEMKHNVFENEAEDTLQHDAMALQDDVIGDWKRYGSMKEAFIAHAGEYGIENIDYLFPEAKAINNGAPDFIRRPDTWVKKVMDGVHHTPFSRIKSMYANITEDEARALGYVKGNLKKEEVFSLLKRITLPQTVYKKQKLDRDDVIDITDFDVVAWIKGEMRLMLDEELARAFIFGDGRLASSDDKIFETNIRPVVTDADLYTIRTTINAGADDAATAKNMIRAAIKARKDYRGSGNPKMFIGENWLSEMLLLEDTLGHALYKTEAELATKMRVSEIVAVPDEIIPTGVYFVILNLNDYNVGADKGGAINMFDDFDIDYNQMKYLIETRCSGALIKPFSAIVGTDGTINKNPNNGVQPRDWKEESGSSGI